MRKLLPLLLLLLLVSCSADVLDNSTLCYVSFSAESSRSVTASVTYPSYLEGTWTLVATKTDGGDATGSGTYTDVLLTDTFGPFSAGSWSFTLSNGTFEGTAETTLHVGGNSIPLSLHTTASEGTFSFEESNFSMSDKGAVTKVILNIDGEDAKSWTYMQMTTTDGDLYMIPGFTKALSKGIHTLRLRYVFQSGDYEDEPVISFRIDGGATTHITTGLTEGNLTFSITLDTVEPIVND